MKKFLIMLATGCIFLLPSCKSDKKSGGDESSAAKKNLAAAQKIMTAFQTGDVSAVDSVVAEDFLDHTDKGDVRGRDSLKKIIQMVQAMQMKMSEIKVLANDDYVFQWLHFNGTSDGKMGMPAGPYDFSEIELVKFKDGKAVEHWALMEPRTFASMMGGMKADSGATTESGLPSMSSSGVSGASEKAKKNLETMHSVSNMFSTGDFSKVSDYFAEDIVDWGSEKPPNKGLANVKADLENMAKSMGDMKSEVIAEVSDDDVAMSWMKFTGSLKMDMMGKKAGEKYEASAIEVARFNADGKCVEHWTFMEQSEIMKMMGGQNSNNMPPPPPVKDTTKNK